MPIGPNSALAQVKLLAAKVLTELPLTPEAPRSDKEMQAILRELNEDYQRHAPRIKALRERTITFDQSPNTIDEADPRS
jgi:hypothetical protein